MARTIGSHAPAGLVVVVVDLAVMALGQRPLLCYVGMILKESILAPRHSWGIAPHAHPVRIINATSSEAVVIVYR